MVELPAMPGLDTTVLSQRPLGVGLHIVAGANNAGKTRLLRAIEIATLVADVKLGDEPPPKGLQHAMLTAAWNDLPPLRVRWPRLLKDPKGSEPSVVIASESMEEVKRTRPGFQGVVWEIIQSHVSTRVVARRAVLIPTNRYFPQEAPLTQTASTLKDLRLWASMLGNFERSNVRQERETFRRIAEAFAEITELRLQSLGQGGQSILHVIETGSPERPFDECGDGLRDVVGMLLHAMREPEADLLVDEPGLRLHPRTQRRLLAFLEREAKNRAIWIASHDSVFLGAPIVGRRLYVRRVTGEDRSVVEELADRETARRALLDLGWEPGDALLADKSCSARGLPTVQRSGPCARGYRTWTRRGVISRSPILAATVRSWAMNRKSGSGSNSLRRSRRTPHSASFWTRAGEHRRRGSRWSGASGTLEPASCF